MNKDNLEKLRNVMCTYVWEHLDEGYVQGMCDLVAPFLVIFNEGNTSSSILVATFYGKVSNFHHPFLLDSDFRDDVL